MAWRVVVWLWPWRGVACRGVAVAVAVAWRGRGRGAAAAACALTVATSPRPLPLPTAPLLLPAAAGTQTGAPLYRTCPPQPFVGVVEALNGPETDASGLMSVYNVVLRPFDEYRRRYGQLEETHTWAALALQVSV